MYNWKTQHSTDKSDNNDGIQIDFWVPNPYVETDSFLIYKQQKMETK